MSICLVDTSILCEILQVPNRCGNHQKHYAEMERKILQSESLLLPMSAIIETGNHIGHIDNGHQRRKAAMDFVDFVKKALLGQSPFTATQLFKESESLLQWLDRAEDRAFREQVRQFLNALPDAGQTPLDADARAVALKELRTARKNGLLTGTLDPNELANKAAPLARHNDPAAVVRAEWAILDALAESLRTANYPALARFHQLSHRRASSEPGG